MVSKAKKRLLDFLSYGVITYVILHFIIWGALSSGYYFTYNKTSSLPKGIYFAWPAPEEIPLGSIILYPVPEDSKEYFFKRTGAPKDILLMKPLRAKVGDRVCVKKTLEVFINGEKVGPVLTRDKKGRDVPIAFGCHTLKDGELFPFSDYIPNSFDGRHHGLIQRSDVKSVGKKLF